MTVLTTIFNEKANRVLTNIYSSFLAILMLSQIVYFNFYHSIFSFFSLTTGAGQVMQFWQRILEIILNIWYVFLLVLIPLAIVVVAFAVISTWGTLNSIGLVLFLGGTISAAYNAIVSYVYIRSTNKQ